MKKLIALTVTGALALGGVTACGSHDDDTVAPSARGPANVSGQSTCVYIEVPEECRDSDVPVERWFQAPAEQPAANNAGFHDDGTSSFLMQVFMWHVIYSTWFSSPYYVDRYVPRNYRTVYVQHNTTFVNHYSMQIKRNSGKASYRNSKGKAVPANKVDPKKFAPPRNSGGDRGTNCDAISLSLVLHDLRTPKPKAPAPKPKAPAPKPKASASPTASASKASGNGGDRGNGGRAQHGC
jgi:hypothetical protein